MTNVVRKQSRGFTLIELLVVIAIIGVLIALLLPAVQKVRESAKRANCMSNLKQIALALRNYHDSHRAFPPANTSYHSWATFTLPYLEQDNLHKLINFKLIWSHASHQSAVTKPLKIFQCPSTPEDPNRLDQLPSSNNKAAISDYAAITGLNTNLVNAKLFPKPDYNDGVLIVNADGSAVEDITDGAANTVMFIEDAGRPFHWLRTGRGPANLTPGGGSPAVTNGRVTGAGWADIANPMSINGYTADGLKSPGTCPINCSNNAEPFAFHSGGINAAYADGSVKFISETISIGVWAALVTRAGGEVLSGTDY